MVVYVIAFTGKIYSDIIVTFNMYGFITIQKYGIVCYSKSGES